jgi:hypothetical protein
VGLELGLDERPHRRPELVVLIGEERMPHLGQKFTPR